MPFLQTFAIRFMHRYTRRDSAIDVGTLAYLSMHLSAFSLWVLSIAAIAMTFIVRFILESSKHHRRSAVFVTPPPSYGLHNRLSRPARGPVSRTTRRVVLV